MSESVLKIAHNIFILRDESSKSAALVEIAPKIDIMHGANNVPKFVTDETAHIVWGAKDDQPNVMHKIATENDVKWQLIFTKRDFIIGRGINFGYERNEGLAIKREPLPETHQNFSEIEDFLWPMNTSGYFYDAAMQACFSGNVFNAIEFQKGKMLPPEIVDCMTIRYRIMREGECNPTAFLLNGLYGTKHFQKKDSLPIPVFNAQNPLAFPKSILHAKHRLPGQPFYAFPGWWGTKAWTEVANRIPIYHMSGLLNGYNLKYLIKLPDDYFEKEGLETQEEKDNYQTAVLKQMKNSLAGEADRAVVTFYKHDLMNMKALPGVEIIPLKNTMTDDAYVSLNATAKGAQASGHDVLAILASVDTGSKMGGSGKELEVAANFQQKFRTAADRSLLLRPIHYAQMLNGWDRKIKFWFDDVEVYNPDVTPKSAGVNPKNNANNADENVD